MKAKLLNPAVRLAISASLTVMGLAILLTNTPTLIWQLTISDLLLITATLIAGLPIIKTALVALRYKVIGIDLLVSIAIIGATFIGEYWEAAVVAILFRLGHYLEARALQKTRHALKSLIDEAPDVALVQRGDEIIEVKPDEVGVDEIVVVRTGGKIPVDGLVIDGQAAVNQASITGESMPVDITVDDQVYSGSLLASGYLRLRAEKVGQQTLFSTILQLVEEAQDKKANTQAFLERFSSYYTPAIIVLALVVYALTRDIYLALTLLVIACPGALVIATPVSIVAGIGNGARRGILIKGGEAIEQLNAARVIAFDKTGTLTEGQPRVIALESISMSDDKLLALVASAEYYSEHPLGRVIVEHAATTLDHPIQPADSAETLIGRGIKAIVDGHTVLIGNRRLLEEHSVRLNKSIEASAQQSEQAGHTAMLVARDQTVVGIIAMTDRLRPGVKELITQLSTHTDKKLVMLSGDNQRTARAIADELGIDAVYSELLPDDKVRHLKQLKKSHGSVAMVGDGINDAPALATADVGIAAGGPGKDVAMETADIVLTSGNVAKLGDAVKLSSAVVGIMKTNIYFAVSVVIVLLIGVLTKNVIMSFGMLIHVLSVLLVIMNASRLIRYKKTL